MSHTTEEPVLLTPLQIETLRAAKTWWQEGERALDYLAERERLDTVFKRLQLSLTDLRAERDPNASRVGPILRLARQLSANRALNRTLETDTFALALRALLYGDDSLPTRLQAFLQTQRVGPQTASHLLYAAFPDRYPLVSDTTRTLLALAPKQRAQARQLLSERFGEAITELPRQILTLLTDFAVYEEARRTLTLPDFVDLNAVLWHAREMPKPARKRTRGTGKKSDGVRESGTEYQSVPEATEADLLDYIEASIEAQGFTFPLLTVRNYYIALKTKPFVILTGLSGTGKTRLTRLLADALTGGSSDQYLLIPVRPDWTDGSALLGYHNLLTDRYISTPFLDRLNLAAQPEMRERAIFVLLDEMNLARVEHYFADVLSAMETSDRRILLHEGRMAVLPPNVFLTGSVNIDEATHPFSRKVLDRANTIEFADVHFGSLDRPAPRISLSPEIPPQERQRLFLEGRVDTIQAATDRLRALSVDAPERILRVLTDLNGRLTPRGLHFGYRVRDEVLRYLAAAFTREGTGLLQPDKDANLQTALDLQIVQKVLPRISGTQESLERLLIDLEAWATGEGFPRAATKLARMRTRAAEDGLVTFYEL